MSTTGVQVYGIGGMVAVGPPVLRGSGAPSASFKGQLGQSYFDTSQSPYVEYVYNGTSWEVGGSSSANEFTTDSGIAIPSAGNINILGGAGVETSASGSTITIALEGGSVAIDSFIPGNGTNPVVPTAAGAVTMEGTANQITTTGGTNTLTFSVPTTFIAPGSIASTTSLTAGNGFTVSAGAVGVTASSISLAATAASNFTVTGAGQDLTLQGVGGSIVVASNEAVATAIGITASDAAGGITLTAGSGNINNTATSVVQSKSVAGANVNNQVTNSDNTNAASHASYQVATGGASSGDPYINFLVSGAGVFSMGIDNTDSDNFKISANASLGTSDVVTVTSAGAMTTAAGITATTGNITSTAGSMVTSAVGQGFQANATTNTPGASPQVLDVRHGQVAFTDIIANGAYGTLTLTDSVVTAASILLASVSCVTVNSALQIVEITPGAGSCAFRIFNAGAASTANNILINFWVMN